MSRATLFVGLIASGGCDEGVTMPTAGSPPAPSPGPGAPPPTPGTATLTATRFLAFGNSMTDGELTVPMVNDDRAHPTVVVSGASFPARLQEQLRARYAGQAAQVSVANAGLSGELVDAAPPRLAQLLANSQTQVLLLLHGSTDLLNFGAGGVSPAIRAYDRLAREGRLRGARVFIGLIPPPIAGRQRSVPDSVVRDFNDRLRGIAAGEGAVVVDLYAALGADVSRYIGADGHHPNEAGYRRIAEEFLARISAELEPR